MGFVFLDDQVTGQQKVFRDPIGIIRADTRDDLPRAFAEIEAAQADGFWLAGSLSYELGHALDPHFDAPAPAPLIQLGIFNTPETAAPAHWLYTRKVPDLQLSPQWSEAEYLSRFQTVQDYLEAGDCYQINLTFPMFGETSASATELYAAFRRRQPGRYGAIVSLGDGPDIISFSPELFFEKRGAEMRMRPMKGTRPRGGPDDANIATAMRAEPKSQAENLMIVDLLRNDLSRLCHPGSVKVPELFALEAYPTVYQMTSQVTGTLREGVGWRAILEGLFPCGSVTGAPKIRAMEIIRDLESGPRGAYCGSVGYIAPDGDASFSVAIRTLRREGEGEGERCRYDVGSGVVLDSDGADEYRECLLKAKILDAPHPGVIETCRRLPDGTIPRRDLHAARLARSTHLSPDAIKRVFDQAAQVKPGADLRIRIEVQAADVEITDVAIDHTPDIATSTPLTLALSRYALTEEVQATQYKSNQRDFYDGERARIKVLTGADEVIFLNTQNALCEGSFTSLFLLIDGTLLTPNTPGILPGVLREEMINTGQAESQGLTLDDLHRADEIYVGNSLRGLIPAKLLDLNRH